jgi:hypothetical protein
MLISSHQKSKECLVVQAQPSFEFEHLGNSEYINQTGNQQFCSKMFLNSLILTIIYGVWPLQSAMKSGWAELCKVLMADRMESRWVGLTHFAKIKPAYGGAIR